MKFSFNTGRRYTDDGQIINVEVRPDRIYFHDESRGIAGSVEKPMPGLSEREIREHVLHCYDYGAYRNELIPKKGEAFKPGLHPESSPVDQPEEWCWTDPQINAGGVR
jgi:hypothetical protein